MLLGAILIACEAPKEIGLPPEINAAIVYTDTITVKTSTVLLDSVRTSGALRLLAGNYQDPLFGRISARTFFDIGGPLSFEGKTYEYDSVAITMSYGYFYGDTLQPFEFGLHQLTDSLQANKTYYNISSTNFQAAPLATSRFTPSPFSTNSVRIRLPNTYGKAIFDAAAKGELVNAVDFRNKFKGFAIVPKATNAAVIGFVPASIVLQLYIHETGATIALASAFSLLSSRRFNQVLANRQASPISALRPLQPVAAAQTGGVNYVQDALGVVTKIEFPTLARLLANTDKKRIAINRAELTIVPNLPVNGGQFLQIPTALAMIETDESNRILRTKNDVELFLPDDSQTYSSFVYPQVVPYDTKFRHYNFILTTYLQAISTGFKKSKGLLLTPINYLQWVALINSNTGIPARLTPYLGSEVNRLTITPTRENLKLQLFYTVIQ